MDFYNTKYICSYNDSDIFLDSEIDVLTEDEKYYWKTVILNHSLKNKMNIFF